MNNSFTSKISVIIALILMTLIHNKYKIIKPRKKDLIFNIFMVVTGLLIIVFGFLNNIDIDKFSKILSYI